jgi:hypothetical protein
LSGPYPSWIAGLAHKGRGRYCLKHLHKGSQVTLRREPDNLHDAMAVAVTYSRHHIGYIPQRHRWVAEALDEGRTLACHVTEIDVEGWLFWKRARQVGLIIDVRG